MTSSNDKMIERLAELFGELQASIEHLITTQAEAAAIIGYLNEAEAVQFADYWHTSYTGQSDG